MNKLWIVVGETYRRNVKSVSFLVMILMPFIIALFYGGIAQLGSKLDKASEIAIVSESSDLAKTIGHQLKDYRVPKNIHTKEEAEKALKDKDIDGFLEVSINSQGKVASHYFGTSSLGAQDQMALVQALNSVQTVSIAENLKLTGEDLALLGSAADFSSEKVSFDKQGKMKIGQANTAVLMISVMVVVTIMYSVILTYSSITAQEIASEKGTRIMEVILSSISAKEQYYGKLIGILLVSGTQVLIYAGITAGIFPFFKDTPTVQGFLNDIPISEVLRNLVGYNILYFLLGILIFSVLASLCGSLVSKMEDVSKAIMPVTYLSIIGYFLGLFSGMMDPDSGILKVTSYIPFLSSFTMPVRIANGNVAGPQIWISLLVLLSFTIGLMLLSSNLYAMNVLMYSDGGVLKNLKRSINLLKNERKSN